MFLEWLNFFTILGEGREYSSVVQHLPSTQEATREPLALHKYINWYILYHIFTYYITYVTNIYTYVHIFKGVCITTHSSRYLWERIYNSSA